MMRWEPVIGIEAHVQLATQSKLFSGASTRFGSPPNTQASLVDLALPGTLPVINRRAVEYAILFGLAVQADIQDFSLFARKNYFYPDLPKGYQISQFDRPILRGGHIPILLAEGQERTIPLERAHLEEDAGKSLHDAFPQTTAIDLNRAGIPLLEVVSQPLIYSAEEAVSFAKSLHTLVRSLKICDGNLQEGSFRCDINISLRPKGAQTLGTRVEIKNLNSFRFMEQAIHYEVLRQSGLLAEGKSLAQETRLFNPDTGKTQIMRSKEEAHDYRYFPDPDLLPIRITAQDKECLQKCLPELPYTKYQRYRQDFSLPHLDAKQLADQPELSEYFDALIAAKSEIVNEKLAANWVLNDLLSLLHQKQIPLSHISLNPKRLAELLNRVTHQTLSSSSAKIIFQLLWESDASIDQLIEEKGLSQIQDNAVLETWINAVINDFPEQAAEYRAGKEKLLSFFVGQVMKRSQGRANPARLTQALEVMLKSSAL